MNNYLMFSSFLEGGWLVILIRSKLSFFLLALIIDYFDFLNLQD